MQTIPSKHRGKRFHGDRERYEDPTTHREVIRVWFQPDPALPGRWLTAKQWAKVYDDA